MYQNLESIFKSVTGAESVDLEPAVEAVVEEVAEAIIDKEIAEVEKDVAEACQAVDQHETAIEAVEEKLEDLQEQISGLESMMNGTTAFNASLFAHQLAAGAKIAAKFGAPIEVQGSESYADASTAQLNALAGVESLKETAVKAGGAIKKFFVDLYASVVAVITGLFSRLGGISKKAQALKGRVSTGSKIKEGDVTIPASAAKLLDEKGQADGAVSAITNGVRAASKALDAGGNNILSGIKEAANDFGKAGVKSTSGNTPDIEGTKVKVGTTTFAFGVPKTEAGLGKVTAAVSAGEAGETKVKALSKDALVAICTKVATQASELQITNANAKSLMSKRDKAIASMEAKAKEEDKAVVTNVRNGHRAGLKLITAGVKFGGDILSAQLGFVAAHLGGAEKAPAEDKKED